MSDEFWAIILVGVTLGGYLLYLGTRVSGIDKRLSRIEGFLMRGNGQSFMVTATDAMPESLREKKEQGDG